MPLAANWNNKSTLKFEKKGICKKQSNYNKNKPQNKQISIKTSKFQ